MKEEEIRETDHWTGWIGLALAIAGASLVALNLSISGWGFILYLGSNVLWVSYGIKNKARPVIVREGIFAVINIVAVYRWLL